MATSPVLGGGSEAIDMSRQQQRRVEVKKIKTAYTLFDRVAEFVVGAGLCAGCYFGFDYVADHSGGIENFDLGFIGLFSFAAGAIGSSLLLEATCHSTEYYRSSIWAQILGDGESIPVQERSHGN